GHLFARLSRHYLAVTWQWARDHSQLLGAILASKESAQRWNRCLEYVCTDLKYSERCPLRSGGNRKVFLAFKGDDEEDNRALLLMAGCRSGGRRSGGQDRNGHHPGDGSPVFS